MVVRAQTAATRPAPNRSATAPEATAPATPPVNDEVTIEVTSDPLGAKVYRADKSEAETQPTPISFKMHRGDPPFDIQLRAEGYAPETRTISSDASTKLLVSLTKLPTATPKVEAPPPPKVVQKVEAPAKPATPKVSNVTKPPKHKAEKKAPKETVPDPDGVMQPSFGN